MNTTKTTIDYANEYIEKGWSVLPIPRMTKEPVIRDWQKGGFSAKDFRPSDNIGVLTGEKSGNCMDVDLDTPEANVAACYFLPHTDLMHGRASRPKSHWWYEITDGKIPNRKAYLIHLDDNDMNEQDKKSIMFVEIRGNSHQTVVAPSIHPSGEHVEWFKFGEAGKVTYAELERAAGLTAASALVARYWPKGTRQDCALALAGYLAKGGLDDDTVVKFIEAVADAAGDEEKDQRVKAAKGTLEKIANDQPVTGGPKLVELLGEKVVKKLQEWLGLKQIPDRKRKQKTNESEEENTPRQKTTSQDILLALVEVSGATFFIGDDDEGYARVPVDGHTEVYSLKQEACKDWLSHLYYTQTGRGIGNTTMQDALTTLKAKARASRLRENIYTRYAFQDGKIYVDLANEKWQVVEISADEWKVLDISPVAFRRPRGIKALPVPECGGSISEMRQFFNVRDEQDWVLLLAWVVGAIHPTGPYSHLVITGSKGSAKSTATKRVKALLDPNTTDLRDLPKDVRDLAIAARNNWLLAYDNLSGIPASFSDALCRLSTGGGFSTRKLHSDDDEMLFSFKRPVVINTIEDIVKRTDLLDRAIIINLQRVDGYKSDQELEEEFNAALPRLLGSLYSVVSVALRDYRQTAVNSKYRMIDFARWAKSAEKALGFNEGDFEKAYNENRKAVNELVVESHPLARAIISFMQNRFEWEGTATQLLSQLVRPDDVSEHSREWPKQANHLTGKIRQIESNLREDGIDVRFGRKHGGTKTISVRRDGFRPKENAKEEKVPTSVLDDYEDDPDMC